MDARVVTSAGRAVATLALVGLAVTGCGGGGSPAGSPTPPAVSVTPSSVSSGSPTTGDPTSGGSGPGAGTPMCTTEHLQVGVGEPEGAAGSVYRTLLFRNTGGSACHLGGFPGVSYVAGDDGHQVGPAAAMSGQREPDVRLAPGAAAGAALQLVNVANYDAAVCRPTAVRGLRVYPPGNTAAAFVPLETTGCAGTPPGNQLSVQALRPQ